MKARLIAYTQPAAEVVEELQLENVQDLIAFCARVSNPANQINKETSEKLLNYLVKHKHYSPFEIASATLEIETTRDIARQILRHRSFTFQEFSQRYADPRSLDNAFELRECRLQDTVNRQNSTACDDASLNAWWDAQQKHVLEVIQNVYGAALEKGIAKEQARAVLPEGLTKSKMYMQGTIRSWLHYIELRSANGTQLEHQEIAVAVAKAITQIFPLADTYCSSNDPQDSEQGDSNE